MKKFKFIFLVSCLVFALGFATVITFAEGENTEVAEQTEVTYQQQLDDFWNKWFPTLSAVVVSTLDGLAVILIFLRKINNKVANKEKLTKEDYEESKKLLNTAKEDYIEASAKVIEISQNQEQITKEFVADYNALIEANSKTFNVQSKEIELLLAHVSVLKDLVCKMVASNPELASNGWATEFLKLCDETDLNSIKQQALLEVGENNE